MGPRVVLVAIAAMVASVTIGCACNKATATGQGAEQLASRPDALIQMRRGGCPPGVCPVYSVAIFLDGTVVYDGQANVAVLGHRTAKLSAERLNDQPFVADRSWPIGDALSVRSTAS